MESKRSKRRRNRKIKFSEKEYIEKLYIYIEEIAYMIPINTDIIIEIHCPRVSKEMQEKMENSIRNNYGIEIDDVDYEMMIQNRRALIMFIFGIILLAINILIERYVNPVLSNFICVVWWVAIWDMIEIITIEKSDNKFRRLNYQQLYESKIEFVFNELENNSKEE